MRRAASARSTRTAVAVPQDYARALVWYRKSAEQGDAFAQTGLGVMYANGRGVAQDDAQAFVWFRKAAEQGDAEAQGSLGAMYATGPCRAAGLRAGSHVGQLGGAGPRKMPNAA